MTAKNGALALGVHFGLPDELHHADDALGSTRVLRLHYDPTDYWWFSPLNPKRPPEDSTEATEFGKAVHKFVLEGEQAFRAAFVRRPDDHEGATPSEKGALTKAAKAKLKVGQTLLHGEDYDRVVGARDSIALDPELSNAFDGGVPEVTVVWERDGVRLKARIDYLKPRACVDLKNLTVTQGSFRRACLRQFELKYDVQAALYLEGRAQLARFVADGAVHGDHEPELVRKIAASTEWAFVFVFLRANSAPITFARKLSPGNRLLDTARAKVDAALTTYRSCMERFGAKQMWLAGHKIEEFDESEMSPYYGME